MPHFPLTGRSVEGRNSPLSGSERVRFAADRPLSAQRHRASVHPLLLFSLSLPTNPKNQEACSPPLPHVHRKVHPKWRPTSPKNTKRREICPIKSLITMLAFQKYIYYLCSISNTTKQLFRTSEELFEPTRVGKNTVHSTIHSFTTMKKLSLALVAPVSSPFHELRNDCHARRSRCALHRHAIR